MTVFDGVDAAARSLVAAGFSAEDARGDAAVLARHLLGWTTTDWAARLRDEAPSDFVAGLTALTRRRAEREPVAYITGLREFYGRPFRVTPDVLIPRPETEAVVDEALAVLEPVRSPLVADVGTGTGCIAVTIALERPDARVFATDISSAALDVARTNATQLGATIRFVPVSASAFLPADLRGVHLIATNPPYVPERDRVNLATDVKAFEPPEALFAGDDGLDVIRQLVPEAASALRPGGYLVMEIGAGQADAVQEIVAISGLRMERIRPDLRGIPRVVVASLRS